MAKVEPTRSTQKRLETSLADLCNVIQIQNPRSSPSAKIAKERESKVFLTSVT